MRLLVLLLMPALAFAGPLQDMDAAVKKLRDAELPADVSGVKVALEGLIADFKEVERHAPAATEVSEARARLRMGEANLAMAEAFVEAPCPEGLEEAICAVYDAAIAERSLPFFERADALLTPIDPADLPQRERKRLTAAAVASAEFGERARIAAAALPEPKEEPAPLVAREGRAIPWTEVPKDAGWSLIWKDAELEGAGQTVAGTLGSRSSTAAAFFAVRHVGADPEREGRTLVQTGHPFEFSQHCARADPLGRSWRLTFSVPDADLVPVTTKALVWDGDDGTKVSLNRGVPVVDGWARLGPLTLAVGEGEWAGEWAGASYQPQANREVDYPSVGAFEVSDGAATGLSVLGNPVGVLDSAGTGIFVSAWDPEAGLATYSNRCGEAVLRTTAPPGKPQSSLFGALNGQQPDSDLRVEIPKGTVLHAPDGTAVGETAISLSMPSSDWSGERPCTRVSLSPGRGAPTLMVCVDRGVLEGE